MDTRTVEKNGVSLASVVESIKRGDAKDSIYAAFIPTEENFSQWVNFFGTKTVLSWLAAQARKDAQAALDYVLGDKWKTRKVIDPETKKESEQWYYDAEDLDIDKYYEVLISGVARGGVTKAELMEDLADVNREMASLVTELQKGDPAVSIRLMELGKQWQDLSAAIEAKKREPRKPKATEQAAA